MTESRAAAEGAGHPLPREDQALVLNVDDYEAGRYATTRILRRAGFEVIEAGTGEEALVRAHTRPDLVVLDVNLPDVDGFEVCRRLKADPETASIPVLYLSALYHDTESRVRGLEAGADAYLKQPVEPRELVATAHALLRARHVAEAVRRSEERFRSLIEATAAVVWATNAEGEVEEALPSWCAFTGQTPEEARGWGWLEAIHEGDRGRTADAWREALTGRSVYLVEHRVRRADGEWRTLVTRAVPVMEGDGSVREWVGVGTDVTERRLVEHERDRAFAEAEAARAEAEEANRAKSGFLANMSHELRTPINAIMGYTDLIEMGIDGPVNDEQTAKLQKVRLSSRHLLGLVDEILDLARIESGQMTTRHEPARLADAVAGALALVQPQAEAGGIGLEDRVGNHCGIVYDGDEDRVRQILVNLLSNAVKFTERGGRITVSCGVTDRPQPGTRLGGRGPWTFLRVEDTGWGIAPEQLDSIFEPFVQGETGHTRRKGGTGLGLTISRQLARLMGGDLTVRSEVGVGSCFTLWLLLGAGSVGGEAAPAPGG